MKKLMVQETMVVWLKTKLSLRALTHTNTLICYRNLEELAPKNLRKRKRYSDV